MYIVTIKNGYKTKRIHDRGHKLLSGTIVQGINAIDSFSFTIDPTNHGYNGLNDFTTLVEVYNTNKDRYEFYGRVLCSTSSMSESGLVTKEVTCESYMGFLCDSFQPYTAKTSWSLYELLEHLLNNHNSQLESYKHIRLGNIGKALDPIECSLEYDSTWKVITEKILKTMGGEIRFRVVDGVTYLDYSTTFGEKKDTEIALSKNMKSITQEQGLLSQYTRVYPLGCKLKDSEGKDTGERLTMNRNGYAYYESKDAIERYGLHVGVAIYDDIDDPEELELAGAGAIPAMIFASVKYSITALDLSLLGLDIDDFEVYNSYPVKNRLLGIDDIARITKKTIDICEETKTAIEIGEAHKLLSQIQKDEYDALKKINADIVEIKSNYVLNETLINEITKTQSLISQSEEEILLKVSAECVTTTTFNEYREAADAELALKVGIDENDRIVSMLNAAAQIITITSNRLIIASDNFTLSAQGKLRCKNAVIEGSLEAGSVGGFTIANGVLTGESQSSSRDTEIYIGPDGITSAIGNIGSSVGYSVTTLGAGGITVEKAGSDMNGASFMRYKHGSITYELYVDTASLALKARIV